MKLSKKKIKIYRYLYKKKFNFDKADNDIKKLMIKRENIQNI